MEFNWQPQALAILICRLILGILFLFQGYEKIFRFGISGVENIYSSELIKKGIPSGFIRASIFLSSWIEFLGGILLIAGIWKYYTLAILGLNLTMASLAFSVMRPMWDMQHVFPRLMMLLLLLIAPPSWDIYSIDYIFNH